ncbi:MAG: hypothetical protein CM15mP84_03960 [Cellvibrionales bacterium]|nr:MAG: hypothetical protein CM15mP84_03960 [Cellvibrionales bacterium]
MITVNCAILGASLLMQERSFDFAGERRIRCGCRGGLGIGYSGSRRDPRKLKYSDVPDGLQGLGITFITVGLMSLGFMSFGGIDI